jgi:outer membrane protein
LSLNQDFNTPATIDDFHTQVLAQQTVFSGGRRGAEFRAAEADVQAADLDLAALENELIYRVAEAYYRLLQARDLVAVRREAVAQVERHVEIVQVRYRAETAVKSDVLSVEVRLAEVRESLLRAENDLELAWTVLENVVGRRFDPRILPEAIPPAPWSDAIDDVQGAVAEALESRPEVRQLAQRREAAAHRVDATRAGYAPQVDLTADYDVYTGDLSNGNDSFFVGVVARLNLFDAGRTAGQVREACARLQELTARQDRLLLDIELQVRQAYLRLQLAGQRLEVATQAAAAAQESLREIEVRYRGEVATITELIDAQVALTSARGRRTAAQADLQIAQAALQQAVGRLTRYAESPGG